MTPMADEETTTREIRWCEMHDAQARGESDICEWIVWSNPVDGTSHPCRIVDAALILALKE
jgi:hypothetical protein